VIFPVADNLVNNIPQITGGTSHLFKSRPAKDKEEALVLYERVPVAQKRPVEK